MHRIITGATGLIGKRLVAHWLDEKHQVTVVGRSVARIKKTFGERVTAVSWDQLNPEIFEGAEVVVNLAGANIGAAPWSAGRKKEILNSRVQATKRIVELIADLKNPPALFNASAIGIYGLQQQLENNLPQPLNETLSIDWANPPDFLSEVACRWEEATRPAVEHGLRVVFLRFGVVLAKEGGALPMLLRPVKYYVGSILGEGNQPFTWVALDDLIRAIDFLLERSERSGPFNIVAPGCVTQREFVKTLAKVINRPVFFKMPSSVLKYLFGRQMAHELMLEGQHVYPKRLLDLGFRFLYPDIETALNHILR